MKKSFDFNKAAPYICEKEGKWGLYVHPSYFLGINLATKKGKKEWDKAFEKAKKQLLPWVKEFFSESADEVGWIGVLLSDGWLFLFPTEEEMLAAYGHFPDPEDGAYAATISPEGQWMNENT